MAQQHRPISPANAPDPARSYERAKPEAEAGMGRLDAEPNAAHTDHPDHIQDALDNAHPPRQLNSDDTTGAHRAAPPAQGTLPPPSPVDHSMLDEEPDGWDQAPTDIQNPQAKRHPRKEGKGGTP